MEWLTALYPEVRRSLENGIPEYWPELKALFDGLFENPPPLFSAAILPMACCRAVGGAARAAIPVAAALLAAQVSLRIVDDIEDRDRPGQLWQQIGAGRAWNYAAAIHTLSFQILAQARLPAPALANINQLFIDAFMVITAGQERDLSGPPATIDDYWRMLEWKTGAAYAAACAGGALAGSDEPALIEACEQFGHHTGLTIQVFNDLESIWMPGGASDLEQGKVTLPLLYGLSLEHPAREELAALARNNQIAANAARIQQILDAIDARQFMVWAALQQRDAALTALASLPANDGRDALEAYVTGMFGDLDVILRQQT